jgi:hypothetical protein
MVTTRNSVDPPSVDPPSEAASSSSDTRGKRGYKYIDSSTLAQFAEDIEESGGIEKCIGRDQHLYTTVLGRKDRKKVYFPPADPKLHERLQKKCWAWQQLYKKGTYASTVLARYGVVAFEHRKTPQARQNLSPTNLELQFAAISIQDNPQSAESPPRRSAFSSPPPARPPPRASTLTMAPSHSNKQVLPLNTSKFFLHQ